MTAEEIATILDPMLNKYGESSKTAKDAVATKDNYKTMLVTSMDSMGVKTHSNDKYQVTYTRPVEYYALDVTAIKQNEPEIYEKYKVLRTAGARLTLTAFDDIVSEENAAAE